MNAEQMHRFVVSDLNFHNMLMRMTINKRLLKVVNDTRLLIRVFAIQRPSYDVATLERIHHQHNAIFQTVTGAISSLPRNCSPNIFVPV